MKNQFLKKATTTLLILTTSISLVACGNDTDSNKNQINSSSTQSQNDSSDTQSQNDSNNIQKKSGTKVANFKSSETGEKYKLTFIDDKLVKADLELIFPYTRANKPITKEEMKKTQADNTEQMNAVDGVEYKTKITDKEAITNVKIDYTKANKDMISWISELSSETTFDEATKIAKDNTLELVK